VRDGTLVEGSLGEVLGGALEPLALATAKPPGGRPVN